MTAPAVDFAMILGIGAGAAFLLTIAVGLLFNLVERARRARPSDLDHFGSRRDG